MVLLGFLMRLPPPLLAIHLLWINLVTDTFPAVALGMEEGETDIMKKVIAAGIPVWSEIELAYIYDKGEVIGITGTKGKTTV